MTHVNHPCSVWTRETIANYSWHLALMKGLLNQYTRRYKKKHIAEYVYRWLSKNIPPGIKNELLTPFPLCIPDDCKVSGNAVECYREYYKKHKSHFAKWKIHKPIWWE